MSKSCKIGQFTLEDVSYKSLIVGKLPKGVPKIELQEDKSHQWTDVLRQMIIMCTEPLLNLIKGPLMSALGTLLHLLDSTDK